MRSLHYFFALTLAIRQTSIEMKRLIIIILFFFDSVAVLQAQQTLMGITHSGRATMQSPFPLYEYKELSNPAATDNDLWNKSIKGIQAAWGSTNVRYSKEKPSITTANKKEQLLTGWKGERVSAQFVVCNNSDSFELSYTITPLVHVKNKRQTISPENYFTGFVRYVMTDELNKDRKGGCGYRNSVDFDSSLVADPIDHHTKELMVYNKTTQAGWLRVQIPEDAEPGVYTAQVQIKNKGKIIKKLPLRLNVVNRVLPAYNDWKFHLDLWQNPYAVARYYSVKPWSSEHFTALQTEMLPYVQSGGKVITASIMHKPWGGQTYDYFESMVTWIKKVDNTWQFDFSVFDKWVQFMMDLGVDKQINCYSMVPWKLSFQYFDQATNSLQFINTKPGEKEYAEMWTAMLKAFAAHLKQKGWFDKTFISMDERPMDAMLETLKVIKSADKNFKVSLAGALHEELIDELDDYCVALRMKYKEEDIARRRAEGKVTTFYTSCEEPYPNTFTFSNPAESEWMAWYAAKANLDGYLRWAYNSWVLEPLLDSRFITWPGGDTYFIYPGGRTSMRFEKLTDGIQAFEKIQILKNEFAKNKNNAGLKKIEEILQVFDEKLLQHTTADIFTEKAMKQINAL